MINNYEDIFSEVTNELEDFLPYLSADDEAAHYDGFDILIPFISFLAVSFLDGFLARIRQEVKDAGGETASKLIGKVKKKFQAEKFIPDKEAKTTVEILRVIADIKVVVTKKQLTESRESGSLNLREALMSSNIPESAAKNAADRISKTFIKEEQP